MKPKQARHRAIDIKVTPNDIVLWKCAAALEPVPPTWAGPTWAELLTTPVDRETQWMTVKLPTSFTARYRTRDDRETLFLIVPMMITEQALLILEKHGLQRIPVKYTRDPEPDGYIPF
ncbi:MAG: hypothetical protein F9K29_25200 [Hyphomicrobiaceae bacterium]|nr:MAG: hypothetical protein F9K29_25200 [Hyphomicrobiaceae bacterium]